MKFIAYLFVFVTACAVGGDEEGGAHESALGNCSFIPGCQELLEARDGPFTASVMTYADGAVKRRRLAVTYHERVDSQFLLCARFPHQPPLTLVFVVGTSSIRHAMLVDCPTSWGDNVEQSNSATLSISEDAQPALWDAVFPPGPGGERWFALQLAATNADGAWDSRHGANYRLVLEPR